MIHHPSYRRIYFLWTGAPQVNAKKQISVNDLKVGKSYRDTNFQEEEALIGLFILNGENWT